MTSAYQIHLVDTSRDHNSATALRNLVLRTDIPKPIPGSGEALVRIRAAALNFRDLLVLVNSPLYLPTTSGISPLADGAGTIEETGPGSVWEDSIGTKVLLCTNQAWIDGSDAAQYKLEKTLGAANLDGTLRQYAIVADHLLVKAPKNLNHEEAASMIAAGGTAINALSSIKITKGTTVLTQGTGGVSCFAIQYAAAMGATVIATSSTDTKLEIAKRLGATELINYNTTPEWADEVLRLTQGRGVDLVVEVGGAGTIEQSIKCVRDGGMISLVGFLTASAKTDLVPSLLFGGKTVRGIRGNSKAMIQEAVNLVEEHDLHPVIERPFEWEDAYEAYKALKARKFVGKLVIKV